MIYTYTTKQGDTNELEAIYVRLVGTTLQVHEDWDTTSTVKDVVPVSGETP